MFSRNSIWSWGKIREPFKTSVLCLTNRHMSVISPLSLNIDGTSLFFENCIKFLGIKLDFQLNFSHHIDYICSKMSKSAGIIRRICNFVPKKALVNLYYAIVYPYLIYGVLIWGNAPLTYRNSLLTIQKKIIRTLTLSDYLAHTAALFHGTGILRLDDVYRHAVGIYMYKQKNSDKIVLASHHYDTRNRGDAIPTYQWLTQCQRSLTFIGPKYWNEIPSNIRNLSSLNKFKKEYKKYLLGSYLWSLFHTMSFDHIYTCAFAIQSVIINFITTVSHSSLIIATSLFIK